MDPLANPLADPIFDSLYVNQREHVIKLGGSLDNEICIIDPSDTGTGKTYTGSALAKWKKRKIFVISPKPVCGNWFTIPAMFGVEVIGVSNYEALKNGKYYETLDMYFRDIRVECPYIQVLKDDDGEIDFDWDLPEDTLIIVDEAHRGKNHITINSQLLVSMKKVLAPDGPKLLLLSATPTDKVECFRVMAYLLGLSQYGKHAYRAWLRTLARQYPGCSQIEAIHKIVFPRYGARMRKRDLMQSEDPRLNTLFKGNDIRAEVYDISPEREQEIMNAYHDIEDAITALKTKQMGEICPLTIILRARQRIELLKVDTMILLAMEYLLNDKSVVIFVNFDETATQLFQKLDDFVQTEFHSFIALIHGGQSPEDRAYQINAFQTDRARLMIANIKAGGVGLSLHDVLGLHARAAIISPTWSSIDLQQVLGRIHRAGAKSDAIQRIVYCRGKVSPAGAEGFQNDTTFENEGRKVGVEELIAANVNKKLRTIEWFNNGDEEDLTQI